MPSEDSVAHSGERYSIDELASLAGVTPRTVRYYIAEGLLSRPIGEKRGAHYLQQHVDELVRIRRWTEAGHSLDRVRDLLNGAPEDPARKRTPPGSVEVWSRMTVSDGLEVHLEPGRAGLGPEQVRRFLRMVTHAYREVRETEHDAAR